MLTCRIGLNSELDHYYPNGRSIQTTSVHPTWANTPLLDEVRASLVRVGQHIMPAEDVADAVVKQVLSGRGAQLFIPPPQARLSHLRGWPNWMQELLRGVVAKSVRTAES